MHRNKKKTETKLPAKCTDQRLRERERDLILSKYVVGTHLRYSRSESGAVVFLLLLKLMPLKEMVLDDAE